MREQKNISDVYVISQRWRQRAFHLLVETATLSTSKAPSHLVPTRLVHAPPTHTNTASRKTASRTLRHTCPSQTWITAAGRGAPTSPLGLALSHTRPSTSTDTHAHTHAHTLTNSIAYETRQNPAKACRRHRYRGVHRALSQHSSVVLLPSLGPLPLGPLLTTTYSESPKGAKVCTGKTAKGSLAGDKRTTA